MNEIRNHQELMDHVSSFPTNLQLQIYNSAESWIKKLYKGKVKIHPGFWSNNLPRSSYQIISSNDTAQIYEKYFRLQLWIHQNMPIDRIYKKLLDSPSYDNNTIRSLIESIVLSINPTIRSTDKFPYNKTLCSWIVIEFLPYKLEAYSIYNVIMSDSLVNNTTLLAPSYLDILLSWINKEITSMNNGTEFESHLDNISVGAYLFLNELNLNPERYGYLFASALRNDYFSNYVYKKLCEFNTNHSDFMICLEKINTTNNEMFIDYFIKKYGNTSKKPNIVPNYSNDILSEEDRNDTIVFGKNILNKELGVRDFVDLVRNMTHDYVSGFICNQINDDITFKLSYQSKMFIHDTKGIDSCEVITKDDSKTVIRYTDENGNSALFVLVEPVKVDKQTIYGLSLDSSKGSRGMISIEKDRNGPTYKFIAGGAIPNGGNDSSEA